MAKAYRQIAIDYAEQVVSGKKTAGAEIVKACERFLNDLKRDDLELRDRDPDFCINIMQNVLVHTQGEDLNAMPFYGKPFRLEPFQIFIVYNLFGFYWKGTEKRRFKEAFIEMGRKNGKTSFVAGLAFAVSILQRKSGSKVYVVASALKQTMEAFHFLTNAFKYQGISGDFEIKDNSFDHSIKHSFVDSHGNPDGYMEIIAMPSNPDSQDSFNCNFAIADEIAAYKKEGQYSRFKEAMIAYENRMIIGITTAGDNVNSFGYSHQEACLRVVNGIVQDDSLFVFIARCDQAKNGDIDYTDPAQHEKANPNYGVTIRPNEIMEASLQAQNDPMKRKSFISRRLCRYTAAMKSYFDIEEFKRSDMQYTWTLDDLAKLPINWYGGADLSRMHDLTAAVLFGNYQGVDIVISHAFFPITAAAEKADKDNIPLFGWKDNGWLTLCNSPTVNMSDVVNWFSDMRAKGFKIKLVGHDKKFAGEEYFPAMMKAGFRIKDQPQYYYVKSQGFRYIERSVKDGRFYYLHSEAYEYCVANVHAIEKTDDAVQYEKVAPTQRIDLFDASVFACICYINESAKEKKISGWFG